MSTTPQQQVSAVPAQKAQYDPRTAILVDGLESRTCLSTILSYTCSYEDAKILAIRLCKKGTAFVQKDEGDLLKNLCVLKENLKKTPSKEANQ